MKVVIVGGGVAGLRAAGVVRALRPELDVLLLERAARVGGLVDTERTGDGFLIERGPDAIATYRPGTMDRLRDVGLAGEIVTGTEAPRRAFVAIGRELLPLPEGLVSMAPKNALAIFRSPLFSTAGKARMALEPFVRPRRETTDESVASFVERRFGRELLDRLVQPLLGGIHSTPITRLSVQAALPRLVELERAYGSVAAGLARQPVAAASGGPALVSFRRGMRALVEALAARVPELRTGVEVTGIARDGRGFILRLGDGARLHADAVIVATPAWAAAELALGLDEDLAGRLGAIGHGSMTSVTLAFRGREVSHPLAGTGFVVPAREGRALGACTWASQKFPGRAPSGAVLMRCFLAIHDVSEASALVEAARADLRDLLGIEAPPLFHRADRIGRALPQYEVGHLERVAVIERHTAELGAFALAGNAYRGLGLAECMASGEAAAAKVTAELEPERIFVAPAGHGTWRGALS